MTALFIVNDFPPILGGQSSYLYNLCRAYPSKSIIVLAPSRKGDKAFDREQPFTVIRRRYVFSIPVIEKIVKIILPLFYARPLIRKYGITQVHCGHVLSTGIVGLLYKILFKKEYIIYTYSADITSYQRYLFIKKLMLVVLRQASRIVAISRFNRDCLTKLGIPAEKITIISPKIDIEKYRQPVDCGALKARHNLAGKQIILSVNRLVERKGNDTMIRALPRVLDQIPEAVYVIAGSGPYGASLKKLAEETGVRDHVVFVDGLSDDEVAAFYQACDVFVMLSREIKETGDAEGFGIVFLEANAVGKPVVAGDSGGMPDAVVDGKTGFLVDPLDAAAVKDAVVKILKDPDLARRLGEYGRQRVENEFDWRRTIAELREYGFVDQENKRQ